MVAGDAGAGAGSVFQVRECTLRLMNWAKSANVPVLIAGHVTKEGVVYEVMAMGTLAGDKNAKLVPHMTHTVTLTGEIADGAAGKPKMLHATALKMISKP